MNRNYYMPKAELHCHLVGCVRTETVYHYNKIKQLIPKETTSMHETQSKIKLSGICDDLNDYLKPLIYVCEVIQGNPEALTRIAQEICQDKYNDNVRYLEVRYSPHLLANENVSPRQVIQIITKAFKHMETYLNSDLNLLNKQIENNLNLKFFGRRRGSCGEKFYDTAGNEIPSILTTDQNDSHGNNSLNYVLPEFKVKTILCGYWPYDYWLKEIIELIEELDPLHEDLVGIDIFGGYKGSNWKATEQARKYEDLYRQAKELNINTTINAGEDQGAESVTWGIEELDCNRIGHGYRLIEDEASWARYLPLKIRNTTVESYNSDKTITNKRSNDSNSTTKEYIKQKLSSKASFNFDKINLHEKLSQRNSNTNTSSITCSISHSSHSTNFLHSEVESIPSISTETNKAVLEQGV